jgi:hypothetical protein
MEAKPLAAFLIVMGLLFGGLGAYGMTPGRFQPRPLRDTLKHPLRYRIDYKQAIRNRHYVSQAEIAGPYLYLAGLLSAIGGAILGGVALLLD